MPRVIIGLRPVDVPHGLRREPCGKVPWSKSLDGNESLLGNSDRRIFERWPWTETAPPYGNGRRVWNRDRAQPVHRLFAHAKWRWLCHTPPLESGGSKNMAVPRKQRSLAPPSACNEHPRGKDQNEGQSCRSGLTNCQLSRLRTTPREAGFFLEQALTGWGHAWRLHTSCLMCGSRLKKRSVP